MKYLALSLLALTLCLALLAGVFRVRGLHSLSLAVDWPRWKCERSVIVEIYDAPDGYYTLEVMWWKSGEGPVRSDMLSWRDGWEVVSWR